MKAIVSAAALMALVAGATAATSPVTGTARPIASLTARERSTLPATTEMLVEKRRVTLGVLRSEHQLRLARSAGSAAAGLRAGAALTPKGAGLVRVRGGAAVAQNVTWQQGTPVVEAPATYAGAARDMRIFCDAAQATICLYYPASTTLFLGGGTSDDVDPLITDPALCKAEGSILLAGGCQFAYPNWLIAQFDPGTGSPFAYKAKCDAAYWKVAAVDPHGAVKVLPVQHLGDTFTTASTPASCIVRVWTYP
jgi:hypothetical protein